MENATQCQGICQQSRRLPHGSVGVYGLKLPCVQQRIPICQVHQDLFQLWSRVLEFRKVPARPQVVVIFIDLPQGIADLHVPLVVVSPMLFAAVCCNAAIRAFESNVCGRLCAFGILFPNLGIVRRRWDSRPMMGGVWTVCVALGEKRSFSNFGYGGFGKRVEQVILPEQCPRLVVAIFGVLKMPFKVVFGLISWYGSRGSVLALLSESVLVDAL